MKLIVGLGNHGEKYAETRHNLGWMAVTAFAQSLGASFQRDSTMRAYIAKARLGSETLVFALPTTFMNLSGEAVSSLLSFYHLTPNDLLVVQDELDIPVGSLKFSHGGSPAGHNGIKSINQSLANEPYARLRLGVDKPSTPQPIEVYVLERFSKDEVPVVRDVIKNACGAIEAWIERGLDDARQAWNGKKV